MPLTAKVADPLDNLTEWRETTEAATEGPWAGYEPGYEVQAGPRGRIASVTYRADTEFIATSRTAMPALLTAVENVLALHSPWPSDSENPHRCSGCDADWPDCDTVTAIRDALGGAQ